MLIDDTISGKVMTAVGVSLAALALPALFPSLAPPLRSALKAGATLFLEAEFEAEGGLIDKLVSETIDALLGAAADAGTPEERRRAARHAARRFERRARARAEHWGADDHDQARRYRRHVAHLHRAVAAAAKGQREPDQELLEEVVEGVPEAW